MRLLSYSILLHIDHITDFRLSAEGSANWPQRHSFRWHLGLLAATGAPVLLAVQCKIASAPGRGTAPRRAAAVPTPPAVPAVAQPVGGFSVVGSHDAMCRQQGTHIANGLTSHLSSGLVENHPLQCYATGQSSSNQPCSASKLPCRRLSLPCVLPACEPHRGLTLGQSVHHAPHTNFSDPFTMHLLHAALPVSDPMLIESSLPPPAVHTATPLHNT
jgi:hypothetical protein